MARAQLYFIPPSWNSQCFVEFWPRLKTNDMRTLYSRSSALGLLSGVSRIGAIMGNVVFGQLVDSHCAVPVLLVSALLLTGGLAALRLPHTRQTALT